MDGALGGDEADLVDLLHRAGVGLHHRGHRHLHALAHIDLVFIGVAEIEGELQLLVVDQGGDLLSGGHVLVGLELLHVLELAGKGGPDGEVVGLLQQVLHLRIQVVQLILGLLAADGVQGLTGSNRIARVHKHLFHRTAGGEGNGGGLLGHGVAAAGDLALDGAEGHRGGLNLAVYLLLFVQKPIEEHTAHGQSRHHDQGNYHVSCLSGVALLGGEFFLWSRGLLARAGLLLRYLHFHFWHFVFLLN